MGTCLNTKSGLQDLQDHAKLRRLPFLNPLLEATHCFVDSFGPRISMKFWPVQVALSFPSNERSTLSASRWSVSARSLAPALSQLSEPLRQAPPIVQALVRR